MPWNKRPVETGDREVRVGKNGTYAWPEDTDYGKNYVISSSYTWWNFVPKNLWEQFQNMANVYFLLVGVFQILPQTSTTQGIPTMYQPLAFIVLVSALRALSEDIGRHKADAKRNGYKYDALVDGDWVPTPSGELRPGMLVRVLENEMIPADLILVSSAHEKGHCFIDKANLNGETKLEVVSSLQQLDSYRTKEELSEFSCSLVYEPPNTRFDELRGVMRVGDQVRIRAGDSNKKPAAAAAAAAQDDKQDPREFPVTGKVLLMRETDLKNTPFIVGLVIYTGDDTKIQRSNAQGVESGIKVSRIMRLVNQYLKGMLALQLTMCFCAAVAAGTWIEDANKAWYLWPSDFGPSAETGVLAFFSWFILLSQMVPISLVVSAEMVKFIQSRFIQWDLKMYYEPIDKPGKCNSSTIHEDLGLIEYIFSDKTGTLTQNRMEFRYALLQENEYGSKETEIAKAVQRKMAEQAAKLDAVSAGAAATSAASAADAAGSPTRWTELVAPLNPKPGPRTPNCCERHCSALWNSRQQGEGPSELSQGADANRFSDEERQHLLYNLWGPRQAQDSEEQHARKRQELWTYMLHMALSNTVKPYHEEPGNRLCFQCESAEESAMVEFARSIGFTKTRVNPSTVEIQEYDEDLQPTQVTEHRFAHIATFGFTSQRARVTVIYKRESDDRIFVMCKGQDTVVLPLLAEFPSKDALLQDLSQMATNGLRTLVCASAELPAEWWLEEGNMAEYQAAVGLDPGADSENHPAGCAGIGRCFKCTQHDTFARIEQRADLTYLGCMGLEDQLQLLVPDTIKDCLRAGIKVWMITGDKLDTAKNIGLAANLIDPDMVPNMKQTDDLDAVIQAVDDARLLEITGAWSRLLVKSDELEKLFDIFDSDKDGVIDIEELVCCLKGLKCGIRENKIRAMFNEQDADADGRINQREFTAMMQQASLSEYEAVKYDIDRAVLRFQRIQDPVAEPVSLLVSREAFQVLFPSKEEMAADGAPSAEELEALADKFFTLARLSKSVVFARAEPAMKKRMVTEIQKRDPSKITLAIGDGANDTDMIMAAHIGVGISGVEGTAATNSADYAIGTFRLLHRLLFVHGFWSYQRMSILVCFIFYKAALLALTSFLFGAYSGYSGQQFFNDSILQLYNILFTAFPIMIVAIADQKLPEALLENNPSVFRESRHKSFSFLVFSGWILRSVIHSLLIFFIPLAVLGWNNHSPEGWSTEGLWFISTVIYTCLALVPTFLILFEMHRVTVVHFASIAISVVSIFCSVTILASLTWFNKDLYGVAQRIYSDPQCWLIVILTVSVPMLLELGWRHFKSHFWPPYWQILAERMRRAQRRYKQTRRLAGGFLPGELQDLDGPASAGGAIPMLAVGASAGDPAADAGSGGAHYHVDVVMTTSDETEWRRRKPKDRVVEEFSRANTHLNELVGPQGRERRGTLVGARQDKVRSAVVTSMLRFRNMTGSHFESAAQTKLQTHDRFDGMGVVEDDSQEEKKREDGPRPRKSNNNNDSSSSSRKSGGEQALLLESPGGPAAAAAAIVVASDQELAVTAAADDKKSDKKKKKKKKKHTRDLEMV